MYCNIIHEGYKKSKFVVCPFCNEKLEEPKSTDTKFHEHPNLINDSHIICTNCGTVHGYQTANEYVDFYEN